MDRTRRALLGAAGGLAAGLSGCLGAEGVEYPETGDDDTVETPAEVEEDAFEEDDEPANEALAAATREVVDDAVWFATEYPDAVATYLDAVGDAVDEVQAVRTEVLETGETTREMVDRIAEMGERAAAVGGDAMEPHFRPRGMLLDRTERHVEVLELFAERDDTDRFLEELDRTETSFRSVGNDRFVEVAFSRNPIHNRLLRRLLAAGDSEARETTLVEIGLASRGFTAFAKEPYDDDRYETHEIPSIYGDGFREERRDAFRARLGPVVRPEDRVEELFVGFAPRPEPDEDDPETVFEGWPDDLDPALVYVQRYPDAETAATRLDEITAEGRTEDDEPIDPDASRGDDVTHWHRYLHHEAAGDRYEFDRHEETQYGYVVQAEEFVLAAGFSGDAWEERVVWQDELADGWVTV